MAMNFDGLDDGLKVRRPLVTAYPFSISAWFNAKPLAGTHTIASISDEAFNFDNWRLEADGFNLIVQFGSKSGVDSLAIASTPYLEDTWNHACAVGRSATSRDCYLNGGGKGSNTTNSTPSGLDNTTIGYFNGADNSDFLKGSVAEVYVWNIALSDADVAALALGGVHPFDLRPNGIVGAWPLYDRSNPGRDFSGRNNYMAATEGAVPVDHPIGQTLYWRRPAVRKGFTLAFNPANLPRPRYPDAYPDFVGVVPSGPGPGRVA